MTRNRKIDRSLLILFITAIVVRIAFTVPVLLDTDRAFACTDAIFYHRIASNLAAGNGYSMAESPPFLPDSTVAPGYPGFVAALSFFINSPITVVIVQILLSLILLLILYRFVRRRFGERAALVSGLVLIFDLNFLIFTTQITTEMLFTVLFIPFLALIVTWIEKEKIIYSVLAGVLLGAATLVRSITLYFGAVLLLFVFLTRFKWRKLAGWAIIVVVQIACIAPWVIRNRAVFDQTFYTTVSDMNLLRYHAVPLKASIEDISRSQAHTELTEEIATDQTNEARYLKQAGRVSRRYILTHPVRYAGGLALGDFSTLIYPVTLHELGVYLKGQTEPPSGTITVPVINLVGEGRVGEAMSLVWKERFAYYGFGVFILFVLYGLFHLAKLGLGVRSFAVKGLRDPVMLLFLLSGIYLLAFVGLAVVTRLRVPAEPMLAVLAGIGMTAKSPKRKTV